MPCTSTHLSAHHCTPFLHLSVHCPFVHSPSIQVSVHPTNCLSVCLLLLTTSTLMFSFIWLSITSIIMQLYTHPSWYSLIHWCISSFNKPSLWLRIYVAVCSYHIHSVLQCHCLCSLHRTIYCISHPVCYPHPLYITVCPFSISNSYSTGARDLHCHESLVTVL